MHTQSSLFLETVKASGKLKKKKKKKNNKNLGNFFGETPLCGEGAFF